MFTVFIKCRIVNIKRNESQKKGLLCGTAIFLICFHNGCFLIKASDFPPFCESSCGLHYTCFSGKLNKLYYLWSKSKLRLCKYNIIDTTFLYLCYALLMRRQNTTISDFRRDFLLTLLRVYPLNTTHQHVLFTMIFQ